MKLNRAFTLIEILLVMIVAGIILALAGPNFSKEYARFQLNKTADDLMMVSRWAQAMAIGHERIYALSFGEDHHSYCLMRSKNFQESQAAGDLEQESDGQVHFEPVHGPLGRRHTIPDAVRLGTEADKIEFYPDGTIDPAEIQLGSSEHTLELSTTEVRGMMTKVDSE